MGKTMQKIKIWNIFDEEKIEQGKMFPLEFEAQVDNGAVRVILPSKIVEKLQLRPLGKTKVRYADMREAERDTVHGLVIEILGRRTDCSAIIESNRTVPLIGQIVLEDLDLWIDSKNGKLIPNPESPDMPLLDEI
ncbi:clan AA aspartic protease [Candidatus Poribacteria bacterium]|nr:clan AA aspartic protease [Candidatus Poribacteria bacterium]